MADNEDKHPIRTFLTNVRTTTDFRFWKAVCSPLNYPDIFGRQDDHDQVDRQAILEITSLLFDYQIDKAVERFSHFTEKQYEQLKMLAKWGAKIAPTEYINEIVKEEEILLASKRRLLSIPEDHYLHLIEIQTEYYSLAGRIRQSLELLNRKDERYKFAETLKKDTFY